MATLPQLKNVETYRPCEWDLKSDPASRRYWVELFCSHIETLMDAITQEYPSASADQLASFRAKYLAAIKSALAEPERFECIDILTLDRLRTDVQGEFGFLDPYRGIKQRETDLALSMLPELLEELDATPAEDLPEKLARGLMAGNLFDVGAAAAMERSAAPSADFQHLRASQPSRPWLIDGVTAWADRWSDRRAYADVAFFVDNAGADICLGCIPLARWMLAAGARVTLAANSGPALNDVTAPELIQLLEQVAGLDHATADALDSQRLRVVASGGWAPLIDLTHLTDDCAATLASADLIILLGMGRAIESNWRAEFSCDCLRVGVLKDPAVAKWLGGRLFDCAFQLQPAARSAGCSGHPGLAGHHDR